MPPIFQCSFRYKEGVDYSVVSEICKRYFIMDQDTSIYFTGVSCENAAEAVTKLEKIVGHYVWSYLDFGYFVLFKNDSIYNTPEFKK